MTDTTPQEALEGAEVTVIPAATAAAARPGANGGAPDTKASGWPVPDMSVLAAGREAPPALPLSLFGPWADWIARAAESKSCPPDFVALSLVTAAATLIGNARRAMPWPGWTEPTILWGALVGPPSSGKSPALDTVLDPMREIEGDLAADYPDMLLKYRGRAEEAKAKRDKWQSSVKDAVDAGTPAPDMPADAVDPEKPPRPRLLIGDPTIEAAAQLLCQNPRGLCFQRDELAGWIANFERRGGSDRPFWIEAFGGRPYVVDRVKSDVPMQIPFLSVSIIGGVQPDRLASLLMSGDDDGLASRFLFTWPESVPFKRPKQDLSAQTALTALGYLHELPMATAENGAPVASFVPFSAQAANEIAAWRAEQPAREAAASGLFLSHVGKLPGLVVRLSLVLAYLEWAISPEAPEPETISETHVLTAIGLVDGYFLPMARRCFGDAALPEAQRDAAAIAKWIVRPLDEGEEAPTTVNAKQLRRMKRAPVRDGNRVKAALVEMEDAGWLRRLGGRVGDKGGRQREDYAVNPMVFGVPGDE